MQQKRVAIVGLYRSGSSMLAGVLRELGVDMGNSFWDTHYEEIELSKQLRVWWDEPRLVETVSAASRQQWLQNWVARQETRGASVVGAKHPLLSLCCNDLLKAWGAEQTTIIWIQRALESSIESLQRTRWGWPECDQIQTKLWTSLVEFDGEYPILKVDYDLIRDDPELQVRTLVNQLQLVPSPANFLSACNMIHKRSHQPADRMVEVKGNAVALPDRNPKITATMLSGNCESLVAEAVQSAINLVDEWLLIDTGITDRTVEIVKSLAGDKFACVPYKWTNDFGEARNFSLRVARERGATWAMTVDSDERFIFPDSFDRDALNRVLGSDDKVRAWMLPVRNGQYSKERFVRTSSKLEWKGRTHEALTGFVGDDRKLMREGCFWEPQKSADGHEHKLKRDLVILQEEVVQKPLDPRWWYYLGQTHEGLRDYSSAVTAYKKCGSLDGWANESAAAYFRAAICEKELEQFRAAELSATMGLAKVPRSAELLWLAGFCAYQLGAMQRAIEWCELAIQCGEYLNPEQNESRLRLTFRHRSADFEAPFDVLRFAYPRTGQSAKAAWAEMHYQRAKKFNDLADESIGRR
jgi:tetratricopeptide (TPR) repeat protein